MILVSGDMQNDGGGGDFICDIWSGGNVSERILFDFLNCYSMIIMTFLVPICL